jgi:DNA uptake protein ComE-like DNA-binding protein
MKFTNYFHFSYRERLGSFALFIICIGIFSAPSVMAWLRPDEKTDFSEFEAAIQAYQRAYTVLVKDSTQLFPFDPNLASKETFCQLGLSEKVAQNICRYREKGGTFRKADDFKKIWGIEPEVFELLRPYIRIEAREKELRVPVYEEKTNRFPEYKKREIKAFDLNMADQETLMGLPLVGEKRALQIIAYREKLGGFLSVAQLAELNHLPDSVFQVIRPYLSVTGQAKKKINLNKAPFEELNGHPYISWKQAERMVAYRDQHGPFSAVSDVSKIIAIGDQNWMDKIAPYLTVD